MSDSTSQFDKELGPSTKSKRARTNIYGDIYTQNLHIGDGNNNADAGTI